MDQLIFFSVPGFIIIIALLGIIPHLFLNISEAKVIAVSFSAPMIGFIIHQTYRLLFMIRGGYESNSRSVLIFMKELFRITNNQDISLKDAFLAWETEIYDNKEFEGFMKHDSKSWHFIHSFRGIILACILGILFLLLSLLLDFFNFLNSCHHFYIWFSQKNLTTFFLLAILILIGVIFVFLEKKAYKSLNEQEIKFALKHQKEFQNSIVAVTGPIITSSDSLFQKIRNFFNHLS